MKYFTVFYRNCFCLVKSITLKNKVCPLSWAICFFITLYIICPLEQKQMSFTIIPQICNFSLKDKIFKHLQIHMPMIIFFFNSHTTLITAQELVLIYYAKFHGKLISLHFQHPSSFFSLYTLFCWFPSCFHQSVRIQT